MNLRLRSLATDAAVWETRASRSVIRIGRDPDGEVTILDPTVSRQHARIRLDGDRCSISDVRSRFGTWVNGEPLPPGATRILQRGDVLRFGRVEVVCAFEDDEVDESSLLADTLFVSQANARLLLLEGGVVRRCPIVSTRTVIGGAAACDVRLSGAKAPPEQAVVTARDGRFWLEASVRTTPPRLEQEQRVVKERTALRSGAVIVLWRAQALFLWDFDACGRWLQRPLGLLGRRRLLRRVAVEVDVSCRALRRLTRGRCGRLDRVGELLVEEGVCTPLVWQAICRRADPRLESRP